MDENSYILWLSRSLNGNLNKIYSILGSFGSGMEAYNSSENVLASVEGIKEKDIQKLREGKENLTLWLEENEKAGVRFISVSDKEYPSLLKEIYDPPVGIYVKGKLPEKDDVCISIIGARRCSEYGSQSAYRLSKDAASYGYVVVSGLARGIDSMGHKGALAAGGKTVAVLAFGHNHCYPAENRNLMKEIGEKGCLISEYPPDTKPIDFMFVQRNRIIAGLSKGIVVVEAARKSGTLTTVDYALDWGRSVMAVPSNITSKLGEGTNDLIKNGCPLIDCIDDIILEIGAVKKREEAKKKEKINSAMENFSEEELKVFSCIGKEPVGIEYIKNKSGVTYQEVQYILAMLEIEGAVMKLPGERYITAI